VIVFLWDTIESWAGVLSRISSALGQSLLVWELPSCLQDEELILHSLWDPSSSESSGF
jgi:hypothetical protein